MCMYIYIYIYQQKKKIALFLSSERAIIAFFNGDVDAKCASALTSLHMCRELIFFFFPTTSSFYGEHIYIYIYTCTYIKKGTECVREEEEKKKEIK